MQTSTGAHGARIKYLDGWRGLAILAVLIGHFVPGVPLAGSLGVELFFVLSGRLMADILFVERYPLPQFFRRRLSRIFPALLVCATGLFVASIIAARLGVQSNVFVGLPDYLAALTFTINFLAPLMPGGSVVDHVWSVSVEEHCYVLLAALTVVTARDQRQAAVVCLALAGLAMLNGIRLTLGGGGLHEVYWRTDVRLAPVFLSAGLYLLLRERRLAWVPALAAIAGCAVIMAPTPHAVKFTLGTFLLALAVNTLDAAPAALRAALSTRTLTALGMWSFSIYLWQQPFFSMHGRMPVALLLAGTFCCALGSYYVVEQPARRFLNEHWGSSGKRVAFAA